MQTVSRSQHIVRPLTFAQGTLPNADDDALQVRDPLSALRQWVDGKPGASGLSPSLPSLSWQQVQHLSPEQRWQAMQYATAMGELAGLPGAGPLVATAYAGSDVFKTFQREYEKNKALSQRERLRKTAGKTGEVALFHLLATILLPAAIGTAVFKTVQRLQRQHWMPGILARRTRLLPWAAAVATGITLARPINKATRLLIDWTYRPLVRHKPPKEWPVLEEKLQKAQFLLEEGQAKLHAFLNQLLIQPAFSRGNDVKSRMMDMLGRWQGKAQGMFGQKTVSYSGSNPASGLSARPAAAMLSSPPLRHSEIFQALFQ